MPMIRPMPSPNGTNHERLFILQGRASPRAAYDAAPDTLEAAHASETVVTILDWARAHLSPAERLALAEKLQFDSDTSPTPAQAHDASAPGSGFSLPSGDRLKAMFAQGLAIASAQKNAPPLTHDAAVAPRFDPVMYGRAAARRILSEQRETGGATPGAGGDFYRFYPQALRVEADNMGVQPRTRSAVASALGARSFAEMFPGAERIGSV